MKITEIKVFVCCPGRNFVTVKIITDKGIYGIGDATLNGRELAVVSYLEDHVIPCLIGRDAHQIGDTSGIAVNFNEELLGNILIKELSSRLPD
jgi:mannonate dehydratase